VQCLFLTKVDSRLRSEFKIKHCMTAFYVGSLSFEPLVGLTNNFPEMLAMMRRCAVPMFDQGRFKSRSSISLKCLTTYKQILTTYKQLFYI